MIQLRRFLQVVVFLNSLLFIAYMIVMFVPIGHTPLSNSDVFVEQQFVSYIWFSWYITFCLIGLVWFLLVITTTFCDVCVSVLSEGGTAKKGVYVSLLASTLVFAGQTFMLLRTFLWIDNPLPGLGGWTITQFFYYSFDC